MPIVLVHNFPTETVIAPVHWNMSTIGLKCLAPVAEPIEVSIEMKILYKCCCLPDLADLLKWSRVSPKLALELS